MKRKFADRRDDSDIIEKDYVLMDSNNPNFRGKMSLVVMKKVKNAFIAYRPNGISEVIADNGFKLMQFFFEDKKYSLTIFYDSNDHVLQWYFDIIADIYEMEDDTPYIDDMYLDLVVLPDGYSYVLDEDELENAVTKRIVSQKQYDDAYENLFHLKQFVNSYFSEIKEFIDDSFKLLSQRMKSNE